MLSLMRKHAGSWMIKILLGGIAITFVTWGGYQVTSQRSGRMATVNGETITAEEYRLTYKRLIEQVQQRFGNNLNEEMIKNLQLPKQAVDQLIDQMLMRQAASDLEIRVSDEDLSRSIRSIGAFQTAGIFDPRRYQTILERNNLSPESFELSQRDSLLTEKLNILITGSVKVSDDEASAFYNWNNVTVDLEFVLFEPDSYPDISVTVEEIQQFFERRKDSYKTEPELKVRYLKFEDQSYLARVDISDDEISEYYDEHPDEFQNPKTVEARHILLKVGQNAAGEEAAKVQEKIENILQKVRGGQDFAELAKQYSEGPSKDKGGYLGSFSRESMVKPFADKAFSMEAGEISDPVRTRFGWHIIKVEKVNAATVTALADAKDRIRKKLADGYAKQLAYDAAESIFDATFEGDKLETVAADNQLTSYTTDFFTRQGPTQAIQNKAAFAKTAFELPEGEISEIEDFGDGYYLIEIIGKNAAKIPELSAVEKTVSADLIKEKKSEKAKTDAEALLSALKDGAALAAASKEFDLKIQSTGFFKRNDSIPNIGFERDLSRAAFELSEQESLPPEIIKGRKGYYIIQFRQRQAPSLADFEKEKEDIKNQLLQQKRFKAFQAWLDQRKKSSEIVIEESFLNS
jgi:peptidyl-prolyl cis-trans isomerase D